MEITTEQLPVMTTHVPQMMGYVSHRHPPLAPLRRRVLKLIEDLEAIGTYELILRWEPDEGKHIDTLHMWQDKLGSALELKLAVESDGMRAMRRDVRRFFPDLAGRLSTATEAALYVAEEIERFIRDAILSSNEAATLIPEDCDVGEAGSTVDFEW